MAVAVLPSTLPVDLLARSNTAPASARKPQKTKENKNANERCAACDLYRPLQRQSTPYNHPPVFEKGLGCVECALLCAWTLCVCVWPVSAAGKKRKTKGMTHRHRPKTCAACRLCRSLSLQSGAHKHAHTFTHTLGAWRALWYVLWIALCACHRRSFKREKRERQKSKDRETRRTPAPPTPTPTNAMRHTRTYTHIYDMCWWAP